MTVTNQELADSAGTLARSLWVKRNEALSLNDAEEAGELLYFHDLFVGFANYMATKDNEPGTVTADDFDGFEEAITPGTRLRLALVDAELSVADLAAKSGISRATITNLMEEKTANPRTKTLRALEEALDLDEGHLDA
jgi:DNA-binding Xre family transcriptional regulator